jgi:hypothetical protein
MLYYVLHSDFNVTVSEAKGLTSYDRFFATLRMTFWAKPVAAYSPNGILHKSLTSATSGDLQNTVHPVNPTVEATFGQRQILEDHTFAFDIFGAVLNLAYHNCNKGPLSRPSQVLSGYYRAMPVR